MTITLRRADPGECSALSDLARRSKAHWGYDERFLDACRDELTLHERDVRRMRVTVAEDTGAVVGFYALDGSRPEAEVSFFFVAPERIGDGIGRTMWQHCLSTAAQIGASRIRVESDPFAQGFYVAMGAVPVGEASSGSIPGRTLPVLSVDVGDTPVQLHSVRELATDIDQVVKAVRSELHGLVSGIEVDHIGATSLPDGVTKGDVDVNLRVSPRRFDEVVATLATRFPVAQRQNWTPTYASFADDQRELPVGIQVTVMGSDDDFLVALRDRLCEDATVRREYDGLKRRAAPAGPDAYWQAKNDYLRRLLDR